STPMFLTGHAGREATNPVDRGLFVRTRLLCQEMSPPPKKAFAVPLTAATDKSMTTREKYLRHTQDPMCKGCHELMDPIGFGLEAFDAIGGFRTKENGFDVDASGSLTGADVDGPFHGPAELAAKLVASNEVRACFVKLLYRFGEARPVSSSCGLDETTREFVAQGSHVQDLILAYVTRRDFFIRGLTPEDGP